jgi:membrane protein YdbS with pleckstrin-like domain
MNERSSTTSERSLGAVIAEIREEFKEFASTRVRMIKAEVSESLAAVKIAIPFSAAALFFVFSGALMLTFAAVAAVATAFAGNPWAWFLAFIIIGVLWLILGAVAAFFAYNQFRGRFPKRTVEVLKADKLWLQTEVRRA